MIFKRCCRCGKLKRKSLFYKNRNRTDGCSYACKECISLADKEKRIINKGRFRHEGKAL